jgi:hypothetical protein
MDRFPLLIRYFAIVLPFFGIQSGIEKFFGWKIEKPLACIKKTDMNLAPQSGRF